MGRTGRSASGTCYGLGSSHQVCREASFNWGFVEGKGGIVRSRDCPPQVSTSDEAGAPGVARQGRSRLVLCPRVSPTTPASFCSCLPSVGACVPFHTRLCRS